MTDNTKKTSIFSSSCAASVLMALYVCMAIFNLYAIMFPLAYVDLSNFSEERFVKPFWRAEEQLHMKVYLSTIPNFGQQFVASTDASAESSDEESSTTILLWDQHVESPSLSKSFLLSSLECLQQTNGNGADACQENQTDLSYTMAKDWLDQNEQMMAQQDGGILSTIQAAGQGIESTSILLTFYQTISDRIMSLFSTQGASDELEEQQGLLERSNIYLSPTSPLWSTLVSNSSIYVHVLVQRQRGSSTSSMHSAAELVSAYKKQALLTGQVGLVKFDEPNHLSKPGRILLKDIVYFFERYALGKSTRPPWDMEFSKPTYYKDYQDAQRMKELSIGYPYWKPEVAIKYLIDEESYPLELAGKAGMSIVQVPKSTAHPVGLAHVPALHVDEIGLTSEKYIPINETLTTLPLHVTFDRSDMESKGNSRATTATSGGISPARWRLLSHLSQSIEAQREMGFDQSDIDDLRRLIADTNVTLLAITMLASTLHLLFEFLTFKNEVSFWKNNTDLTGLSVRSLFLDLVGQVIIVLYLIETESSLLMTGPSAIGCVIALWKCQRAAGLTFVKVDKTDKNTPSSWWNALPRMVGYELRATRLERKPTSAEETDGNKKPTEENGMDLHELSLECDRIATKTLGTILLPLVVVYALYSLVMEEHVGWYSWFITSASSAVYALGFVLMTPQLFLNYKLKSVAHLPWRVMVYKSLNTFIDDLFSFIIRMPTMARISCFRDDIVFFIYLYQRWLYPVDESRPVEGGGDGTEKNEVTETKKNQ
eukprot:Nitzschia sp. Nitz4//scaffold13_size275219//75058//77530//NITZ4_000859-RA/size275219-augustus-gene-0.228-mRNA-1//1//CDS//3329535969//6292//frame0